MTLRELRRALEAVLLAAVPAGAVTSAGCDGDPCSDTFHRRFTYTLPADPPLTLSAESCRRDVEACDALCALALERAGVATSPSGCQVEFTGDRVDIDVAWTESTDAPGCPVPGRRPASLEDGARVRAAGRAGAWLARAAWFEAASVHAFAQLAAELAHHGAPRGLIRAALAAADDELRHTTLMAALARGHGGQPRRPRVAPSALRSRPALALDNAVEGCVRETWSAVVAAWQARAAHDAGVRAVFAAIAADELRHAALAWAIDRWLALDLTAGERAAVIAARAAAAHALAAHAAAGVDPGLAALGLPDRAAGQALLARAHHLLWSGGPS